jgi:disulfide bond formation protein DsbB
MKTLFNLMSFGGAGIVHRLPEGSPYFLIGRTLHRFYLSIPPWLLITAIAVLVILVLAYAISHENDNFYDGPRWGKL